MVVRAADSVLIREVFLYIQAVLQASYIPTVQLTWKHLMQLCSYTAAFLSFTAQVLLRLSKVPQYDACPGTELLLFCSHNRTFNDPEWMVINGTQVIFRGITFHDSSLEAHSVIVNRDVLEVVQIKSLQHVFHGLRYICLYDTFWGERESNEVTVKLHGR